MLLVTAGWNGEDYLSSTEIQRTRDEEWQLLSDAEYPLEVAGINGMNIDGTIFMSGKT